MWLFLSATLTSLIGLGLLPEPRIGRMQRLLHAGQVGYKLALQPWRCLTKAVGLPGSGCCICC